MRVAPFVFIRFFGEIHLATKKVTQDRKFAIEAARLAHDRHCSDIVVLDMVGVSPATDYFVIATATSDRQAKSIADEISEIAKHQFGLKKYGSAGYEQGRWILMDYVTVVVHLFDPEMREYYDLEMLWGDAKKVRWPRPKKVKSEKSKGKGAEESAE
jgi:ribosome-associated protein